MNLRLFTNQFGGSVSLSSDTWEAGSVDILRSGGEHFAEDSEVLDVI